jgi:iron complex outermembrane recepter protein
MRRISGRIHSSASAFLVAAAFLCVEADAQALIHFDLPAQPLARSLQAIGTATKTDVGFSAAQVAGFLAPPLNDNLTVDGALTRVLVGTGLRPQHLDDHTIIINATEASIADPAKIRLSRSNGFSSTDENYQITKPLAEAASDSTDSSTSLNARKKDLEEIVVTGTHIRGATDSVSPSQVYTREQIDQSGAGSVAEFLRKLPQNFGDVSENTINGVAGVSLSQNAVGGSGVDLRGLGSDATLVLVDGRRIAPGNYLGNFADVSLIPLSAIERIEVIPDGTSAIYGSDAVGGVINFILRRDFDGAETRARYGTVNDGGHRELSAAQTVGRKWAGGSGLVSYEYSDSTPLSAADRSYSMTAVQPFNLLPEQVRNSAIFTADQTIASGASVFANGSFSHRSTYFDVSLLDSFAQHTPADISAYGGTIGLRIDVFHHTQLEVSGTYAASDTKLQVVEVPSEVLDFKSKTFATTSSFDAKLDGTLWTTAAGAIRFALGGQARRETFDYDLTVSTPTTINASRNIAAEYVELRIPIVGPRHSRTSEIGLELSLADRNEHYSDFGSSNNPEVGVVWRPISDLKIHAVYGKSFKAPSLNDLHTPINDVFAAPNPDPLKSGTCNLFDPAMQAGCTNILLIAGGNPALRAQKATTWSFGLDFQPQEVPALRANANFYHIVFKDRIDNPSSEIVSINALASESFLGPNIIQRNPPPALLQGYLANPLLANPLNINLSTIGALVDSRVQNLSLVSTSGIDFSVSDEASTPFGQLATGLDATYILKFDNRFSTVSPTVSLLNTPYNPIDLKAKGHVALTHGPMNYALLVNYVNSYKDNRSTVVVPIASWTTVDATIGYQVGANAGIFSDASLMIAVTNIANREPPFVQNEFFPVRFDGANANALGRFFSIQLSKRF